jgi:protein-disulfide isomerase
MKTETSSSIPKSKLTLPIAGRDHIQGPIDAPITLLEYGDYECPYCGAAYLEIKAVQRKLGDRLCFAFRNFPLVNSHPHAEHAAEAAEAAGAQGRFWEMHDLLYEHQEALEDEDLAQYAAALGLDGRRLIAEVLGGEHTARVREDFRIGARGGVNGTPTLFINGVLYSGRPDSNSLLASLKEQAGDFPRSKRKLS